MEFPCKVESGVQMLARLSRATPLKPLHPQMLPEGPEPGQIIELTYDNNVSYDVLLSELVINAILPTNYGGKDVGVALLITDGHFNITLISEMLKRVIESTDSFLDSSQVETRAEKCLEKLQIMKIYDSTQFFVTVQSLESLFMLKLNISMIVVDTISAFYWTDRMSDPNVLVKMDMYIKNILRQIQNVSKERKSVILYTKPSYFVSRNKNATNEQNADEPALDNIDYRIRIKSFECAYRVCIRNSRETIEKEFSITDNRINWL